MKLLLRILINAVAIWLTTLLLSGFSFAGGIFNLIIVAIIFGLVNALIRPIVKLLTLPINILTLGLFTLVINALMLMLVVWFSGALSLEGGLFASFFTAFIAAIIISIISTILSWILPD
ncbi:MAG TPA: phage holin family protein [Anaerolineae bacterium]|nr:phage holin family protein [Anaerolineae bacterium]MCB0180289.1 phage holin family protein [Anaerolineae bacterium]MCB0223674.1 phage holin family protein [Anaerolineae bacterium]MCB9106314.1 phage holin family protein [Anaerolineales bacterium]HRV94823.1 phage holin family protein [Anaerolineae bacterium]